MHRWEYLVLRLDAERSSGQNVPHFINGQEIRDWETQPKLLHDMMNELGREGWELVTTYQAVNSLVFKRGR